MFDPDWFIVTGFRALLPLCVAVHETSEDFVDVQLFPDERPHIVNVVEKRRREFITVRHCARQAMRTLGLTPISIPPGANREPLWPNGIVGSMTHCTGHRAAAVAQERTTLAVGIDSETNQPLPEGVHNLVMSPAERGAVAVLAARESRVSWDRLFFSAKESVYKAWYPLTQLWLDFDQCTITLGTGGFQALVQFPGATPAADRHIFHGRWGVSGEHLLTAVHIPAIPREDTDETS